MGKQNRATLKNYFRDGALPSAHQFAELIDSNLNMKDEGFYKSLENGFEICTQGSSTGLISFFRDSEPTRPLWVISFDENDQQKLIIKCIPYGEVVRKTTPDESNIGSGYSVEPAITLNPNGWVGVHTESPGCDLDVNGVMRCITRLGTVPMREFTAEEINAGKQAGKLVDQSEPVPADGEWHNITSALSGCHALEVVAGVGGRKGRGRYALLHTVAMNTFNPKGWLFNFLRLKNRIKCRHAYYRSRSDKLALRWHGDEEKYYLQIRSNGDYGRGAQDGPIQINYHITELWTDPRMAQSWNAAAE